MQLSVLKRLFSTLLRNDDAIEPVASMFELLTPTAIHVNDLDQYRWHSQLGNNLTPFLFASVTSVKTR